MDLLVFVKQVPDDYVEIHLDAATQQPAVAGVEAVANAFDTYALEMAVRYCEAHGGSVTAASIGPESAQSMLKNLLAVGAAKAYLFSDAGLENADEAATASYLAQALAACEQQHGAPYGLVLCGKESTDQLSSQVGARLAEQLKLGFVSSVIAIEPQESDSALLVRQEQEEGYAIYRISTPAVITVAKPAYDPRYPTIKSKMAARKAQIPTFSAAQAGIQAAASAVTCVSYAEPAKRAGGVLIQEKEPGDCVKKAMQYLLQDKVL